jgi:hypothetical protein
LHRPPIFCSKPNTGPHLYVGTIHVPLRWPLALSHCRQPSSVFLCRPSILHPCAIIQGYYGTQ